LDWTLKTRENPNWWNSIKEDLINIHVLQVEIRDEFGTFEEEGQKLGDRLETDKTVKPDKSHR
jgi:hypothetical protein